MTDDLENFNVWKISTEKTVINVNVCIAMINASSMVHEFYIEYRKH